MKMRGYSLLLVCALCVFVLCGAVAVAVAQAGASEKKAKGEPLKDALSAKEKGELALTGYTNLKINVGTAEEELNRAIGNINLSKKTGDYLPLSNESSNEEVKKDIEDLKRKATEAKTAVQALKKAEAAKFKDQAQKKKLTDKMRDVEDKATGVAQAAAAVIDVPTIETAITKAGDLKTAAEEAMNMWSEVAQELEGQFGKAKTAVDNINTTVTATKETLTKFAGKQELYATFAKDNLKRNVKNELKSSLEKVEKQHTASQSAKDAADEVKELYSQLMERAKELKQGAEDNAQERQVAERQTPLQSQRTEDYSSAPFCSLALPAFFFCWCVLFGM